MPVKHINIPHNPDCATISQAKEALEHLSGLFELVEQYQATSAEDEKGRQHTMLTTQLFAVYEHWKTHYPFES